MRPPFRKRTGLEKWAEGAALRRNRRKARVRLAEMVASDAARLRARFGDQSLSLEEVRSEEVRQFALELLGSCDRDEAPPRRKCATNWWNDFKYSHSGEG